MKSLQSKSRNAISQILFLVGIGIPTIVVSAPQYAFVPLGLDYVSALNNTGQAVGYKYAANSYQAAIWEGGVATSLWIPGAAEGTASGIDDFGAIVGSYRAYGDTIFHAVLWEEDLSTPRILPGYYSLGATPKGITHSGLRMDGTVAGRIVVGDSPSSPSSVQATLWSTTPNNIAPFALSTLDGAVSSASAINRYGIVAGVSYTSEGQPRAVRWDDWDRTPPVDLGTLGGTVSYARGINDSGIVVGASNRAVGPQDGGFVHATVWKNDTLPLDLGTLGGINSVALSINNPGTIVGIAKDSTQRDRAALWIETSGPTDLNSQIPAAVRNAGVSLSEAVDINDKGWIVGNGTDGQRAVAALLIPLQEVDPETNPGYSAKVSTFVTNGNGAVSLSELDRNLPTYVITHGWQPTGDYANDDWSFALRGTPEGQVNVRNAIAERLGATRANIVQFEWEGAYTAGVVGDDDKWIWNGSSQARTNAEYAGVLLGRALQDSFGQGYSESIHFIGHSYGTIVNGLATRFLDNQGVFASLDDTDVVQFTTLDAPTDAPEFPGQGFAPEFDADWFENNLSPRVNYLDNYYGHLSLIDGEPELQPYGETLTYGEPLEGAATNQPVRYAHSPFDVPFTENYVPGIFDEFYPNLIRKGADDVRVGKWLVSDWITPTLFPVADDYFDPVLSLQRIALSDEYITGLGAPYTVDHLPGFALLAFQGLLLPEQSPVSALQILDVPLGSEWLVFDWMVGDGGDGDWITVHFGNELLWSMSIDEAFAGFLFDAVIDISKYAGRTDSLLFSLNSVGEKNAQFYIGNLELRGNFAPVPLPPAFGLFAICVAALGAFVRRLKYSRLYV